MKENSKIFKILLRKSSIYHFFVFFPWINKKIQLLQLQLLQLWPPALYVYAISKLIKLGQPARSHLKDLSQSFKMVMDFFMFFFIPWMWSPDKQVVRLFSFLPKLSRTLYNTYQLCLTLFDPSNNSNKVFWHLTVTKTSLNIPRISNILWLL